MGSAKVFGSVVVSSVIYLAIILTVANANDEDLMHCAKGEFVIGKSLMDINNNCSNATCMTLCFLQKLEGLGPDGHPTKELLDKLVDEKCAADIRPKIKEMKCFDEHASKIAKDEDVVNKCDTAKDLDGCIMKYFKEMCPKEKKER